MLVEVYKSEIKLAPIQLPYKESDQINDAKHKAPPSRCYQRNSLSNPCDNWAPPPPSAIAGMQSDASMEVALQKRQHWENPVIMQATVPTVPLLLR